MNDIQRKAGIAIAQHGPLTTLEIARKIGIGSERLRKHLETEWFDFRWAIDRSYRRKVWFLRGDEPPEAGTINGEKSRLFTRWELTATEYKILRIIVDGHTTHKDISIKRRCSMATVRAHLNRIYRKMDVPNMAGMVQKYFTEEAHENTTHADVGRTKRNAPNEAQDGEPVQPQ